MLLSFQVSLQLSCLGLRTTNNYIVLDSREECPIQHGTTRHNRQTHTHIHTHIQYPHTHVHTHSHTLTKVISAGQNAKIQDKPQVAGFCDVISQQRKGPSGAKQKVTSGGRRGVWRLSNPLTPVCSPFYTTTLVRTRGAAAASTLPILGARYLR